MRLTGVFAAAIALAICGNLRAPAAVFGSDERRPLDPAGAHLNDQIGSLFVGDSGPICTAFCVAPDMIATASHCLFGTARNSSNRLQMIRFKRGSEAEGAATPIAGGATGNQSQYVIAGTLQLRLAPPIGADQDWAIARLARASCDVGGLAIIDPSQPMPDAVFNIAIHRDEPDMALRTSGPCTRQERFDSVRPADLQRDFANLPGLIFHDCDTGPGSSGSPLFIQTPFGPEVAGINVGTYVVSRGLVAAGSRDDEGLSKAIANTAVAAANFTPAISELAHRELIESAAEVRDLQTILRSLNLYHGPISGSVTPDLIAAIEQFERGAKQPTTGLASRALLQKLRETTP